MPVRQIGVEKLINIQAYTTVDVVSQVDMSSAEFYGEIVATREGEPTRIRIELSEFIPNFASRQVTHLPSVRRASHSLVY